ncbi:hypothetical protein BH20CHL6_BH20CHL6_10930 [soil metagenome]
MRWLCLLLVLLVVACNGENRTPSPTPPAVSATAASPTATIAPGPGPTDQLSLRGSLLTSSDLPPGAEPGPVDVFPSDPSPAFAANEGVRAVAREWRAQGLIRQIADLRWQFPSSEQAAAFLTADEERLAEASSGLELDPEAQPIGDHFRLYRGIRGEGDAATRNFNFLFTTGNLVGKVLVVGDPGFTREDALPIARAAQARMAAAVRGELNEGLFPNAAEILVLERIPSDIRDNCTRPFAPELAGAVVTIDCRPAEGADLVSYGQYASHEDMVEAYQRTVDFFAVPEGGDCATDGRAEHPYAIEGESVGRIMCAQAPNGSAVIHWTDERLDIRGVAYRRDGDQAALFDFWSAGAGPLG